MPWPARRWVRWLLAALAAALLSAFATAVWLATTEAGLVRAVAWIESIGAAKIRVEGASGRLVGPLRIASIEIDHPRAVIRIERLEADYEPLEILAGRISAEGVTVGAATIRLRPTVGPTRPPSFLPRWLAVVIDDTAIARLMIVSPSGTEVRFTDIRGSAKLTRTRIAFDGVSGRSPGWAVAGASGTVEARDPLALDVSAAWSLTDDNRVAGIARAAGDLDRLLVDARVAAPGTGRVTAEVTNLGPDLAWRGIAEIETLDLAQWITDPPVGPLRATLAVDGDRSRYRAQGVVRGNGLPDAGVRVDAAASYADQAVTFESATFEYGPGSVVRARGTLTAGEHPAYDAAASWTGFRWPLAGREVVTSSRGSLEARGWSEFAYRLSGDFAPAGAPRFSGTAAGRFTDGAIVVEESDLQLLGGRVVLQGSLGRDAARQWSVSGRVADLDTSRFGRELPGRIAFDFTASGTGFGEHAPWSAGVRNLSGTFRGQPVSGGGGVRRSEGRSEFQDVALALGPAQLRVDGVLGRNARLDARFESDDLSALLPGLGGRVNATLLLREDTLAISFTGHDLAWGPHRAVVLSADAHIDRDGHEHSWLRLRSNGITVAGFPITDTRLSLDGLPADHALTFRVGAGADAVSLRGRGSWASGRYALRLEGVDASGPHIASWQLVSASRLSMGAEDAVLEPLCLAYDARRICIEGNWHAAGDWSLKAATDAFPLEALDVERPGAPRYHGLLTVDATMGGHAGEPWTANVRAEIRDAALVYRSASGADRTVQLGLTRLALVSDAERHRLDLRVSDAADFELVAGLEAARIPDSDFGSLPLRGSVRGTTRQLVLLPLLVDDIDNASGEITLDFSVAGRVSAPQIEGEAHLDQGTLDFYQTNLRLRNLRSTLRLQGSTLSLDAKGDAGDGTLGINGQLGWRDRRLRGTLALTGDRLLVANVPEARVLASPDIRFTLDDRQIGVTGDVVIPEARIQPADTADAVLVSSDEQIVRPDSEPGAGDGFEVSSDIRLSLGDKVDVKAYGLSATVTGTVRTRSAPRGSTVASGELEVKEGNYRAYGRELEVERGRLLFTGGPVTDPGVDLRATQQLPGYKVGVIARGRLRRPQLTLFSEPALPQAQIASMLIVGRSSLQGESGAAAGEVSAAERGGAMLAGQLGRYVGIDDIGLAQDTGAGTALVLGKYLSPRLYVSYGISLVDEINTLKLRYTIGDRWVISAESGNESSADIEYRIED